jgi:nitrate reductase NapE component
MEQTNETRQGMRPSGKSASYLLKTVIAFLLMAVGAWGVHLDSGWSYPLGVVAFVAGFGIMTYLYRGKWLWWGSDLFR